MSGFLSALQKIWASFLGSVIHCLEMIVTGFAVILVAAVETSFLVSFFLPVFLFSSSLAFFNKFSDTSSSFSSVSLFLSDRLLSSGILSSKDSNKKMKNYYHIVIFVKAWILLPDITCRSVYSLYTTALSWRLYKKYSHPQMTSGNNI